MAWTSFEDLERDIKKAMTVRDPARLRELRPQILEFDVPRAAAMDIYVQGIIHEFTGEFEEAFACYQQALDAFTKTGADWWAANVHVNIGSIYYFQSDFANAMAEFQHALDLKGPQAERTSPELNNIGAVYYNVGDFPKALEFFTRALDDCHSHGDHHGEAAALMNMGNVYSSMDDPEQALSVYGRALAIHEAHGEERDTFMVNCNMVLKLLQTKQTDRAENHLDRAETIAVEEGNPQMMERVQSLRIHLLIEQHQFDEAQTMIDRLNLLETPTVQHRVNALRDQALIVREQGEPQKGFAFLDRALELADAHNLRHFASGIHSEIMELAKVAGEFERYVKHNELYVKHNEEVRGRNATIQLTLQEKERELEVERAEAAKRRDLLYSTLPEAVANRMIRGEDVSGDHYDNAAVLFMDIAGFTTHSSSLAPQVTTQLLARIFERFDEICAEHAVTKIKTIGDSYMAVSFEGAVAAARTAVEMMSSTFSWPDESPVQFRIGLHTGPVVAGVIGRERLQYDVWGDTVNTASRMESSGEAGRIQASDEFAQSCELTEQDPTIAFTKRGTIDIKGKGSMTTYWLEGASV